MISKFVSMYGLYLFIVLTFDFIYMPWLAIRFKYFAIFPLYISLFIVSLVGLLIYEFFKEDMFFSEKIRVWLLKEGKYWTTKALKRFMNSNPKIMFAAIAIWWSPLHAYIFFREGSKNDLCTVLKSIGRGSLYCALFWGVAIDVLVALWYLGKYFINLYL